MERNNESFALISDKDIQELNDVRTKLEQTLMTKLRNARNLFSQHVESKDTDVITA